MSRRPRRTAAWILLLGALLAAWPGAPTHAGDEDAERESVLALIGARSGEVIADVGCGRGRWTIDLARAVGDHGKVYAQDIDPRKIDAVRKLRKREGLTQAGKIDFSGDMHEGSKAWKHVWSAGQGVGGVQRRETVAEVVAELNMGYLEQG